MSVVGRRKTSDCGSGRTPPLVVSRVPLNAATALPLAVPRPPACKRNQKHHEKDPVGPEKPEGLRSTTPSSILGTPNFNTVPWGRPAIQNLNNKIKGEGIHTNRIPTLVSVGMLSEEAVEKVLPTTEQAPAHCSSRFSLFLGGTDTEIAYKGAVEQNIYVRPLTMGGADEGEHGDETKDGSDGDDSSVDSSVNKYASDDEGALHEKEGVTDCFEDDRTKQAPQEQDRNRDNIKSTTDESGNGLRRSRRLLNHRRQPPPQSETKQNSAFVTSVQVHNPVSKGPRSRKANDQELPQPKPGPAGRSPMAMANWEIAPGRIHRGSGRDTESKSLTHLDILDILPILSIPPAVKQSIPSHPPNPHSQA